MHRSKQHLYSITSSARTSSDGGTDLEGKFAPEGKPIVIWAMTDGRRMTGQRSTPHFWRQSRTEGLVPPTSFWRSHGRAASLA
jgi:hypothetical protein